jgi:hypothetical protein
MPLPVGRLVRTTGGAGRVGRLSQGWAGCRVRVHLARNKPEGNSAACVTHTSARQTPRLRAPCYGTHKAACVTYAQGATVVAGARDLDKLQVLVFAASSTWRSEGWRYAGKKRRPPFKQHPSRLRVTLDLGLVNITR